MMHEERNDMIARQGILMELLKKNNLKAVNTWLSQERVYTFKNNQEYISQIDYVFASRSSYTKLHVHNDVQFMQSDHFPISVYIRALPKRKQKRFLNLPMTGWRPDDQEDYNARVLQTLFISNPQQDDSSIPLA